MTGTTTFQASAQAYDDFMGRYSTPLAEHFAGYCLPEEGGRLLDVGCGPGAFTALAAKQLGPAAVCAVDPAPHFVAACRSRNPGVDVRCAPAEALPFLAETFHTSAAQLVFHFVSQPDDAVAEMHRVTRSGGRVAASVWDFAEGMEMLRVFWDAALALDPAAPDEARTLRFGGEGELAALFVAAGLADVDETTFAVESGYRGFEELWSSFLGGIGPAGAYTVSREPQHRQALREEFFSRLGRPSRGFVLRGLARAARGVAVH